MKTLDDIRVRRAIAFALNREAFLDTMSKQFVGSVYSPVPAQFLPGGLTKADAERLHLAYDQDLVKARRLMIDAGYPDGFTLDLVTSEKRLYRTYYEVMQRQLSPIGIDCRITVETHSNMHKHIRQRQLCWVGAPPVRNSNLWVSTANLHRHTRQRQPSWAWTPPDLNPCSQNIRAAHRRTRNDFDEYLDLLGAWTLQGLSFSRQVDI